MTEAEAPAFDLTLKKKKKKSTKTDDKVEEATDAVQKLDVKDGEEAAEPAPLDFGKKKKKSSKKTEESEEPAEGGESIDFGKKKKKSSKKAATEETEEGEDATEEGAEGEGEETSKEPGKKPWADSDRDYTYEELAGRIYDLLNNSGSDMTSKQKRIFLKVPQVCREGTKKTVWINFKEICNIMKRKDDHVLNYVFAELGTNGAVDGSHRLIIKGRFQPKQIENVLRHYISEYVACRTCKSPNTVIKKENRLYFLCCEACGSTRSVTAIKRGFEAQIGKRKKDKE
eukprot:TRINITY_DN2740_c0_g1_i1.p1 TRINITY_DN2740_c0_g1~~TRINITY_DN2740_c0_g1_i1.p1  ORF type:complete len:285 (+),score=107.43 TRINITY_DN2740_c0_g1_i1:2-856(+)